MTSSVYVVDDDPSVRKSVARLLRSADYAVETFATVEHFLSANRDGREAQCLVLDVQMPGSTGLDLQDRLLGLNSSIGIVFITGHGDISMGVRAIKKGAVDFLPKPFEDIDLLGAVAQALTKCARDQAMQSEIESINQRCSLLTAREREVLGLVVTGMLNKQIADRIGTTEKTVKVHRGRVMEKMQTRSLAQLVQLAAKIGIPPTS